jgi:hypothetical protein
MLHNFILSLQLYSQGRVLGGTRDGPSLPPIPSKKKKKQKQKHIGIKKKLYIFKGVWPCPKNKNAHLVPPYQTFSISIYNTIGSKSKFKRIFLFPFRGYQLFAFALCSQITILPSAHKQTIAPSPYISGASSVPIPLAYISGETPLYKRPISFPVHLRRNTPPIPLDHNNHSKNFGQLPQ